MTTGKTLSARLTLSKWDINFEKRGEKKMKAEWKSIKEHLPPIGQPHVSEGDFE